MKHEHVVLVLSGLDDRVLPIKILTWHWSLFGLTPHVTPVGWKNNESFDTNRNRLIDMIDNLIGRYEKISVVGTSAGGSMALNLLAKREGSIFSASNLCGRLRPGINTGVQGFDRRTSTSKSFKKSVICFSEHESKLGQHVRDKILTTRPAFGDELVPANTVPVEGAHNFVFPVGEHITTIGMSLMVYPLLLTVSFGPRLEG